MNEVNEGGTSARTPGHSLRDSGQPTAASSLPPGPCPSAQPPAPNKGAQGSSTAPFLLLVLPLHLTFLQDQKAA